MENPEHGRKRPTHRAVCSLNFISMSLIYEYCTAPVMWRYIEVAYGFECDLSSGAFAGRRGCSEVEIRGEFPGYPAKSIGAFRVVFRRFAMYEDASVHAAHGGGIRHQACSRARGVSLRNDGPSPLLLYWGFHFR